jgi:hypothetical protein
VEFSFISPIISTARLEMPFIFRRSFEFNNAEEMKMAKAKKPAAKKKAAKKKVAKKKVAKKKA